LDSAALIALSHRTISVSYRPFLGDQAVDEFLGSGAVDRYVRENLGGCWVLACDDQNVGYAVCRDNLIDLMMIDQSFQRRGLGTELLHHLERLLGHAYAELRLESFEPNEAANAFYRKNDWREASRYLDESSGVRKIVFQKSTGRVSPCDRAGDG
jgi:GNAT superfamily N-acetyltransferase